MYITAFNVDESDQVSPRDRSEVEKAVEAMPKAQALLDNAHKSHGAERRAARKSSYLARSQTAAQIIILDAGGQYCHLDSPQGPRSRRLRRGAAQRNTCRRNRRRQRHDHFRRPEQRLRSRQPHRRSRRSCATATRCSASATASSSWRTCWAAVSRRAKRASMAWPCSIWTARRRSAVRRHRRPPARSG